MPSALDSYTNSIYNHDLKILFPLFGGAGVGKTVVKQWFPTDIAAVFIILHVGRVYFTGGFKKPREFKRQYPIDFMLETHLSCCCIAND